jgi:hypothetical protein
LIPRDFDLSHNQQLQDLNSRFQGLSAKWVQQQDWQGDILRELSSSESSILAWSVSHDAQLREAQSMCSQMSDRFDQLMETMSS